MPGIPVLLTVLFVILKVAGVIAWSWLWVLSPLWISVILFLVVVLPIYFYGRKKIKTYWGRRF